MHVKIVRSPDRKKKFRAILGDGRTVDFGASGYSDYTKHKNPSRMRSYVLRHGGQIPKRIVAERQPAMIHRMMRDIDKSDKEDWKLSGIGGAGFWSRWYLWSQPTIPEVQRFMAKRFGIKFI
ncbi:hypothetical protein OlV1_197c [Ostreococcus lucimarinus virus 1]|jgi:hypothetical protein|uniref:hypothetical protein n=1 Tax=Ostreococcus lucimarinus virus 1 TaxID=880162 RepID=UPI0001EF45D7|nr:hypothetical protein OlV1_197c [Ostreococcus lucimarinus virus 1]ADQ91573.1 hypothetical protein OlV1_197c [Ostreococcus lucimarinus virus 1]AET84742.1 hypothetical protein OLOG_00290 [Ostreococcus lucimarinus virus OlV4]QBP06507.1 hypothetical protein OlV1_gene55 [Ostreococcus lucimarinus virus 1]|tara:strand:+ start:192 stop:557 length:366 start_codon:yes stop_codon:yes gene_type:complete